MTDPREPDTDLSTLMHESVDRVRPRHGIDELREKVDQPTRTSPWLVAAAVVATVATLAAVVLVGSIGKRGGTGPDEDTANPSLATVPVYFMSTTSLGPRLFRETHLTVHGDTDPGVDAVQQAVDGRPHDFDYRSEWPGGTDVDRVNRVGKVLLVGMTGTSDLTRRPPTMSAEDAAIAVQQLVYTAQAATGDEAPVHFEIDGIARSTLLGVRVGEAVPAEPASDVLAPVSIGTPRQDANGNIAVSSPFTVQGKAIAFEGNVQWELKQGDTTVRRGFTTTRECCTLSPYSFTVKAPPGTYTLVVHDEEASEKEGGGTARDTKSILVQ